MSVYEDIYENIVLESAKSPSGRFEIIAPHTLIDHTNDSTPIKNDDGTFSIEPVMADTDEEREASKEFIENAKGDVLQLGLGIGLTALALDKKEEVTSVTIVEKYKEVAEMITAQIQFSPKIKIIIDDAFTYTPEEKFDSIFIDLFTPRWEFLEYEAQGISCDRVKLMERLKPYLKDGGWINYFKPI